jgi:hypothetical protein
VPTLWWLSLVRMCRYKWADGNEYDGEQRPQHHQQQQQQQATICLCMKPGSIRTTCVVCLQVADVTCWLTVAVLCLKPFLSSLLGQEGWSCLLCHMHTVAPISLRLQRAASLQWLPRAP